MDLRIDGYFNNGVFECRRDVDLAITPDGDLAIVDDLENELLQALLFYLFIPKNERPGLPMAGCILHEIMHDKMTPGVLRRLNKAIRDDMAKLFPDDIKNIYIMCTADSADPHKLYVTLFLNTGKKIDIAIDPYELLKNLSNIKSIFKW